MADLNKKISELSERLDKLFNYQEIFAKEINELRSSIESLKNDNSFEQPITDAEKGYKAFEPIIVPKQPIEEVKRPVYGDSSIASPRVNLQSQTVLDPIKSNLEKFIGENLISKIGIVILVIGVAIGAKYSIEHHLVSPLTRVIIGYMIGISVLIVGMKLKLRYETYSAVLVSGAMAILYFMTFAAYSFYGLIPQLAAFGMMLVFTAFTVVAAIQYNQQVIAHIGLVGAYAVPFLLSDGSGKVVILFTYMSIINIGILIIAFKKYWKSLYFSAFGLSWLMFSSWVFSGYQSEHHFGIAFTFLFIFFAIFYMVFLAFKIIKKEIFDIVDIVMLLFNSFIFYGLGYYLLDDALLNIYLGLFTLANACIHCLIGYFIYQQKQADKQLFYLVTGLVLVFITITIPVQLDGNWVTLLWIFEAAFLFWIGKNKAVEIYEKLSYPIIIMAFLSLVQDWMTSYQFIDIDKIKHWLPLFNIHFLTSLLFFSALFFINWQNRKNLKISNDPYPDITIKNVMQVLIPGVLIFVAYLSLYLEIVHYMKQLYADTMIRIKPSDIASGETIYNEYLPIKEHLWIYIYSVLFNSILAYLNIKIIKNRILGMVNIALMAGLLILFLTDGIHLLNELRIAYLHPEDNPYFNADRFFIIFRYIAFLAMVLLLFMGHLYCKQKWIKVELKIPFDAALHFTIISILSNELMNWLALTGSIQSDKLGLSIFWGVYALFLITIGIWKKQKHLRIGAIALFSVTLLKLFFYDMAMLDTISKTIVFVSLGILLLIISFLYHKFKHLIADES